MKLAIVKERYQAYYPKPIKGKKGETFKVIRPETNPKWKGWWWCTDSSNVGGWVSESFLSTAAVGEAVLVRDYEATELNVGAGDVVHVVDVDNGWLWCKHKDGYGWLPEENIVFKDATPILGSDRLELLHLGRVNSDGIIDYFTRNQAHFKPTDPDTPDSFYTREYWDEKINKSILEYEADTAYRFILMFKDNPDKVIGTINFSQIFRGPFQACYIGYGIDAEEQGKGLMTEALTVLAQFVFEQKNIHRIMANYMPDNGSSGRVLEKLGFVKEGVAKNYLHINGEWRDHVLTSLTNESWIEK